MNFDEMIPSFLRTLTYNLPAMIAIVAGMVWTYSSWDRHPPAARWAMCAFVWMFITYILAILWYSIGLALMWQNNFGLDDQEPVLMALSCCEAFGYVLFILALNAARYRYRPPQYYDQFRDNDDPPPPT